MHIKLVSDNRYPYAPHGIDMQLRILETIVLDVVEYFPYLFCGYSKQNGNKMNCLLSKSSGGLKCKRKTCCYVLLIISGKVFKVVVEVEAQI